MNIVKCNEWIVNHRVGISSKTMWAGVMGVNPPDESYAVYIPWFDVPYDADDFSRCVDFYDFCEIDQKEDFPKIIARFPFFRPILDRWDVMYGLYKKGSYSQLYEVLCELQKDVRKIKKEMTYQNVSPG